MFFRKPLASATSNESFFFRPELGSFSNCSAMLMGFADFSLISPKLIKNTCKIIKNIYIKIIKNQGKSWENNNFGKLRRKNKKNNQVYTRPFRIQKIFQGKILEKIKGKLGYFLVAEMKKRLLVGQ